MTERWQRELLSLRTTELPDEVWDRAQRGPTGEGLPPRRERIVAGIVAISVFVAAGAFAWQVLRETGLTPGGTRSDSAAIALEVVGGAPRVTLSYGGVTLNGVSNSFSFGNGVYDTLGVDFSGAVFFPVPQATGVTISGSASSVNLWLADRATLDRHQTLDVNDGGSALSAEPGRYALAVTGGWDEGKVTFYFPLEITAPDQERPLASLDFDASVGTASLRLGGVHVESLPAPADRGSGEIVVGNLAPTPSPMLGIPRDGVIWLEGDIPGWLSAQWAHQNASDDWSHVSATPSPMSYGISLSALQPGTWQLLVGGARPGEFPVGWAFVIAVSKADVADTGADPELRVLGNDGKPTATIVAGVATQEGDRGSYCWTWTQAGGGVCSDATFAGPPTDFIELPAGGNVRVIGDFGKVEPSMERVVETSGALAPGPARTLPPILDGDGALSLPKSEGRYVLYLAATWPQGDAQFRFGVRLVARSSTSSSPSPAAPVDAAQVVCGPGGATVRTPMVAAQPDGVHISFANPTGAKQYQFHRLSDPNSYQGGRLNGATTDSLWALEPGRWMVACFGDPRHQRYQDVATSSFTVVDPGGYWIPWELTCADGEVHGRTPIVGDFYGLDPQAASVAFAPFLRGLRAGDRILEPLYRPASFKVPTYVVEREGVVVARLNIIRSLQLTMCRGSHIDVVRTPNQALECPPEERVLFSGPTAFLLPGGSAYVRGNVVGIRQTDDVVQVTSRPSGRWDGEWAVIRDGAVIALVDVPAASGTACSGSGIGGTAITPSPLPAS